MDAQRRSSMRGFSLLEAMISVAILAGTVLALTSAMMGSMHDTSSLVSRQVLTDVASDVLTDLRVATAYQPEVMQALLASPPAPFNVTRRSASGGTTTITVSEKISAQSVPIGSYSTAYDVAIVATADDGHSETLDQTIIQQAVAPGSTVTSPPVTSNVYDNAGAANTPAPTLPPNAAATQAPVTGGGSLFPTNPSAGGVPSGSTTPVQPAVPGAGCIDAGSCYPKSTRGL